MASTRAILAATKAAPAGRPTPAPQGAAPYFGAVSPVAQQLDTMNGYTYSDTYGRFLPRPPQTFTQGAFGPFSPILPVPVDTPDEESGRARPRRVQEQVGWNLPVGEPGIEGLKLATFNTLRVLADLYSVARACIQLRKSEIRGLAWDIMPTPDAAKANKGNEKWFKDFGQRRAQALKFFQRPDPDYFSWSSFIDVFLEEVFVFDALSLYSRRKRGKGMRKGLLGSDLDCLELLSGPTIRPLYGIHGQYPRPPAPAYQQYLYGVPRSDFMQLITDRDIEDAGLTGQDVAQFSGDQLMYLPMVPRRWTPYGFPFIERALIPVMSGLQKQNYALDFFSQGTVPAVYMSPGDESMTPNQIRELQDALNAFAGDPAMHHKIIVLPPGTKVMPQRDAQLADQFDEIVMTQVCCVPGTEVITRRGLVAIENVEVGDTVLTHRGAWRAVRKTMRNRVHAPVRRITAQGLDALEVTGNHPVWTACYSQTKTHRQVYDHTEWVAARDIIPRDTRGGDFDALTLPIPMMGSTDAHLTTSDHIVGRRWPTRVENGYVVHPHPHVKPIPASVPMDAALGRLLGFYMAEGSASNGQVFWYFHENETAYHQQVVDDLKSVFGLDAKVTIRPEAHVGRVVCNSALLSELVSCGTARNKHLPDWAWDGSPEFYAALLWAWVAGDGTLTPDGWRGYTMSRTLAWQMRLVSLACGHEAQFRTQAQPYSVIQGREIRRDADAPIYVLQVVLNKGTRRGIYRIDGPHLTSAVRSNELSTYDGKVVFNLEVEGDESYVTTGGTVHNCMAADVMPMELGIAPKVSTTMSPGSANQMAKMTAAKTERKSTKPLLVFISDIMNAVIQDVCRQDDMRFVFEGLEEEEDQEQLTGLIVQQVSNGLRSIDEGRDLLGLQPWGLPETSGPIFTSPTTGPVPLVAAMQSATANAAAAVAASHAPAALPPGQQKPGEVAAPSGAAAGGPGDAGARTLTAAQEANDTPGHAAAESVDTTAGGQGARGSSGSAGGGKKPGQAGGPKTGAVANNASSRATTTGTSSTSKMTVTVGLDRAVTAELEALARHLRKGRLISTWEPRNVPPRTLAVVSEHLAKGLDVDQAVAFAKATTLAGDAAPKAAGPSAAWPAWRHNQTLADAYRPRIAAAFRAAQPAVRALLDQYDSGALSVTRTVLESMVGGVVADALRPVLSGLWREAWLLGDRSASAVADGVPADWGDWRPGAPDTASLGDGPASFDRAMVAYEAQTLGEISGTRIPALVDALDTLSAAAVADQMAALLDVDSRAGLIARNEVDRLVGMAATDRYAALGVTHVVWLASEGACSRICIPNVEQGPVPLGELFQSGVAAPPAHVDCACGLGPASVEKLLRRAVPLNGQVTWTEADPAAPNAAGGGGQSPVRHWGDGTQAPDGVPVTGGVPGSTAGGEPPRWDTPVSNGYQGGLNDLSDRTNPAQGHSGGDDSKVPYDDRPVAVDARGAGYPIVTADRWPSGGHGTEQASGSQVPGDENDRGAWGVRKKAGPIAAGIAVLAADTGRVLMLQRAMSDDDPAAGFFEFPGGCLEDDETMNVAARREWEEETGIPLPVGEFTGQWAASNGKYHGYVYTVPHEADVPIHDGRDQVTNPDDPDGDQIESLAWFDPQHLVNNPAIRPELVGDLDDVFDALGVTVDKSSTADMAAAVADAFGSGPASDVMRQLSKNFDPRGLGWVIATPWTGPQDVPLADIDFDDENAWAAHHQDDRVQHFVDKLRAGETIHPAVLVRTPRGTGKLKVVDGHHRALAYRELDRPVRAYVGRVPRDTGPWDETHLYQHHQGDDAGNT